MSHRNNFEEHIGELYIDLDGVVDLKDAMKYIETPFDELKQLFITCFREKNKVGVVLSAMAMIHIYDQKIEEGDPQHSLDVTLMDAHFSFGTVLLSALISKKK